MSSRWRILVRVGLVMAVLHHPTDAAAQFVDIEGLDLGMGSTVQTRGSSSPLYGPGLGAHAALTALLPSSSRTPFLGETAVRIEARFAWHPLDDAAWLDANDTGGEERPHLRGGGRRTVWAGLMIQQTSRYAFGPLRPFLGVGGGVVHSSMETLILRRSGNADTMEGWSRWGVGAMSGIGTEISIPGGGVALGRRMPT